MYGQAEKHIKSSDQVMGAVIDRVGRCRLDHRSRNRFDVIVSSIVSQQLSATAARTIKSRVIALAGCGDSLDEQAVCDLDVNQLRETGLSRAKANYISTLAKEVVEGYLDLYAMDALGDKEVCDLLTSFKGIGRWTVEMFLIFALGRPDVLSTQDAGLLRAVRLLYGFDTNPSKDEFISIAECWRPYRSIASWYLWRSLD